MAHVKAKSSSHKATNTSTSTVNATAKSTAISTIKSVHGAFTSLPLIGLIIAEFLGTFIITVAFLEMQGSPLFYGFALIGAVLMIGGVSGAHLNPAVTIGALATRKITALNAFLYVLAQILGAVAAWWVLTLFAKASVIGSAEPNAVFHSAAIFTGSDTTAIQSWTDKGWLLFYIELLGTSIMSLGIATALRLRKNKIVASFAAGLAATIALYITLTLASSLSSLVTSQNSVGLVFLNPAIAAAAGAFTWPLASWEISIYAVAPVIGGVIGFILQDYLYSQSSENSCDCECSENCTCCK